MIMQGGKFRGLATHRMIVTLGGQRKIMWFRRGDLVFGIRLCHCSVMILSKEGSGAVGFIKHKVEGAEHSYIWGFDVRFNK